MFYIILYYSVLKLWHCLVFYVVVTVFIIMWELVSWIHGGIEIGNYALCRSLCCFVMRWVLSREWGELYLFPFLFDAIQLDMGSVWQHHEYSGLSQVLPFLSLSNVVVMRYLIYSQKALAVVERICGLVEVIYFRCNVFSNHWLSYQNKLLELLDGCNLPLHVCILRWESRCGHLWLAGILSAFFKFRKIRKMGRKCPFFLLY